MDRTIVEFADDFIMHKTLSSISNYELDYSEEIDGLYIDIEMKHNIKDYYNAIQSARKVLSTFSIADFSNDDFFSVSLEYLESVKNLLLFYFKNYAQKSILTNRNILNQIIESDMTKTDENQLRIGIGNPMILESLVISYFQIKDFENSYCNSNADKFKSSNSYLISLNKELIINKIDRLFRDIIVLYNKEFYRIVGFDKEHNSFTAVKEDILRSIETISATRLYEKIKNNTDKKPEQKLLTKVLLIGSTIDNSLDLLKSMLEKLSQEKYTIDVIDSKEEIEFALRQSELEKYVNKYDKIFVLDCPELYYSIELDAMQDYEQVIRKTESNMETILGVDPVKGYRDFFNRNGFASIYYRVQNYLIDTSRPNTRKSRKINTAMLDYLKNLVATVNNSRTDKKELYVYISNNHDFRDELYDMYNFTRLERYNSKDCRIIRFGTEHKPKFKSNECKLHITFYKLLKMISNSEKFFTEFTGCINFVNAVNLAKDTHIFIDYGRLTESLENEKINIFDLQINIQSNQTLTTRYKSAIEMLIKEAFDFSSYNRPQNIILSYCYKKAVANVLSGCAHSFNDLLFHHLYMQTILKFQNITFNILEIKFEIENEEFSKDSEETTSYSYKRFAYHLMDTLDGNYYNEASIINHFKRAAVNRERLDDYTDQIISACINIGYTNSRLFYRLKKYY